ncbi:S24 family peptidase [Psychromonas ossibalaenae]|uniref:S24 family peptidase n=1 Tax=Psychromonas ossibalaenae TaxID=444922 RepID=UPI000371E0B2|nr:S24 family peptidase [Psychromonas ossibalaenae]
MDEIKEQVQEQINELKRLTQTSKNIDLAKALGVARNTIQNWKVRGKVPDSVLLKAQQIADHFARHGTLPVTQAPNDTMSSILEFDVQAAAGAGSLVCSEHSTGTYSIPTQSLIELGLKAEHAVIVFCSGDSMESLMSDGDRIIVDIREQQTPVKTGIYVIRIDEAVYVKRLKWNILEHSYTVESENKDYDDFVLEGNNLERLKIIGKAKLIMKSL